jgi:hypothetical protein
MTRIVDTIVSDLLLIGFGSKLSLVVGGYTGKG